MTESLATFQTEKLCFAAEINVSLRHRFPALGLVDLLRKGWVGEVEIQ